MDTFADLPASRRVKWLARIALLWAVALVVRLVHLQVVRHEELASFALDQQTRLATIQTPRGTIYDRNLKPLAMSVPVEKVIVNPRQLPDRALAAQMLASVLGIDAAKLAERIEQAYAAGRGYLEIAKRVDSETAGRLRGLGVDWIAFEDSNIRRYPNGTLASHLLGGVNHEEHGNGGVELRFDDELSGDPGYERVIADVRHRGFDSTVEREAHLSRDLMLTIDRRIQYVADTVIRQAVIDNQCDSGSAMVVDPYSGEVLALANYPTYDPNEPPTTKESYADRRNLALIAPGEPGSVFKVFTIAAALESTDIKPSSEFFCHNGSFSMWGRVLHEAKGGYGTLTVEDILAKSSNIGAVKIGMRVGEKKLHEYLTRFGFGQPTGIEAPSESEGKLRPLRYWQPGSMGSVPMGHEVMTTTAQLARAMSAIANNGKLVRLKIAAVMPQRGVRLEKAAFTQDAEPAQQVIRPETAITMRQMLERVVLVGTGKAARLDGYTSGGKTGTAQMYDFAARKYTHRYNASFMGFAPVTNPAVVVVVTLNGSTKYGGVIAAPAFREITQSALRVLNVPQDVVQPDAPSVAATPAQAPVADGAPATIDDAAAAKLYEETIKADPSTLPLGPVVPNLIGKSTRAVLEIASERGLRLEPSGSGIARRQDPPPGTRLTAGERIKVFFER